MQEILLPSASSRFWTITPEGTHTQKDALKNLRDHGFRASDFALESIPYLGFSTEEERKAYCYDVANTAAKLGIDISFGHLPYMGVVHPRENTKEAIREKLHEDVLCCIRAAGCLGMERVVLHPVGGYQNPKSDETVELWFKKNIEYYSRYLPEAEKAGVTFCVENMRNPKWREGGYRYGCTGEEIAAVAKALGIYTCWDTGHAHTSGLNQYEELLSLKGTLRGLHLNDNHGEGDEHLLPYFGTVCWEEVLRGLAEIGYRDTLNFECKTFRVPDGIHGELSDYGVAMLRYFKERIIEIQHNREEKPGGTKNADL